MIASCAACKATGRKESILHKIQAAIRIAGSDREPRYLHRIECWGGPAQMAGSPCVDIEMLCASMSELWSPSYEEALVAWNEINVDKDHA